MVIRKNITKIQNDMILNFCIINDLKNTEKIEFAKFENYVKEKLFK